LAVAAGDTIAATVPVAPVIVYVAPEPAPPGVKVKLSPEQMVPLLIVIVGIGVTTTLLVAVLEATQPSELVPVTVYVPEPDGDTTVAPPWIV
jgi:hypothetical protein